MNPNEYLVFKECGGPPRVKHDTFQSAANEAQRIAEREPGSVIYVLQIIAAYKGVVKVERL